MAELRTWDDGRRCDECCNGDRCDDHTHHAREKCPHCKGTGWALWTQAGRLDYAAYLLGGNTSDKRAAIVQAAALVVNPPASTSEPANASRLNVLASFAHEVAMGAIRPEELRRKALDSLAATGLSRLDDVVALTSEPAPQAVQALEVLRELVEARAGIENDWSASEEGSRYRAAWVRARTLASASDAAQTKCLDCGDAVPKQACYCQANCVHAMGDAAQTEDRKLLEQALEALEHHSDQTRTIWRTEYAIAALRVRLGKESRNA